ncbi:MAG: glycosyltransferase family 2 protein [Gemmatimonadota bacterium]
MSTQVADRGHAAQCEQLDRESAGQEAGGAAHALNVSAATARVHVIIPALDEEAAIGGVIRSLRAAGFERLVVVDNGSRDGTSTIALASGARVVREPRRGYGAACLAGMAALEPAGGGDIVAFVDGDGSDDVAGLHAIIAPLLADEADLVLGSRTNGVRERGALPAHARFGNRLAGWLIRLRTGYRFSDLGPMRALHYATLVALDMRDRDYGWTVEMQLKAARARLRVAEVPVRYRRRIGRSKISGTVRGSVQAGVKILKTIARHGG